MNLSHFLSFAIPVTIIVFAVLDNAVTSTAQRSCTHSLQRDNCAFSIRLEVGLGVALLALAATIYSLENLT